MASESKLIMDISCVSITLWMVRCDHYMRNPPYHSCRAALDSGNVAPLAHRNESDTEIYQRSILTRLLTRDSRMIGPILTKIYLSCNLILCKVPSAGWTRSHRFQSPDQEVRGEANKKLHLKTLRLISFLFFIAEVAKYMQIVPLPGDGCSLKWTLVWLDFLSLIVCLLFDLILMLLHDAVVRCFSLCFHRQGYISAELFFIVSPLSTIFYDFPCFCEPNYSRTHFSRVTFWLWINSIQFLLFFFFFPLLSDFLFKTYFLIATAR